MNLKLRNILIGSFVAFLALVILRATGWHRKLADWAHKHSNSLTWLAIIVGIGLLIYYIYYYRKRNLGDDTLKKCWEYANTWYSDDMNYMTKFKFQDTIAKKGWFNSKTHQNRPMYGFNTVTYNSQARVVIIVGTQPLEILHFQNTPGIGEKQDPFSLFYKHMPTPIEGYQEPVSQGTPMNRMNMDEPQPRGKWIGSNKNSAQSFDEED